MQGKTGDRIKVVTKTTTEEGIIMPSPDPHVILIKLDNGYNLGLERKSIKELKVLKTERKSSAQAANVEKSISPNKSLPTISILHTGGTIASKVDYRTGGVVSRFSPAELLQSFPELQTIANIESTLISQMWSDDLRFKHFSLIAAAIEREIKKGVKGVIIGMGTDNLAVAAAALAFILEKTPVPVIFVGSQRSSDRGSSDAGVNLISAASFITQTDFTGVAICMHEHSDDTSCVILPATKTYKLHSSRRDAFKPINAEPIARITYADKKIHYFHKDYPHHETNLIVKPKMAEKVGLLKIHVHMVPEQFSFYQGYKGLIIEGTGLGQTPGQVPNPEAAIHKKMYPALKKVIASGCIVVMTTQCLYGTVNMNVYSKGRDLQNLGVISGKDMLANTAFVKLSWLLANYPPEKVKTLIDENLRGELNERRSFTEDFI